MELTSQCCIPSEEELEDAGPRAKKIEMTTASVRQTDDRGEYRIFGLKPGEYYFKATETGGGPVLGGIYTPVWEENVRWCKHSAAVRVYFPGVLQLDQATGRRVAGWRGNASRLRDAGASSWLRLRGE